jgi:hypothetical protein
MSVTAIFGYTGALIATWTYLPGEAPLYHISNGINLGCSVTFTVVAISAGLWMRYDNKKREKKQPGALEELAGLSRNEIQDLEWKHPEWRWKP